MGRCLEGPLACPYAKFGLVVYCNSGGNSYPEQLTNLIPIIRNHAALDDINTIEDRTKISGETVKQIFWQTSVNEQRPKLKNTNKWCCH